MDVNQTYCSDHFSIYTNIQLLRCTHEIRCCMSIIPQSKKNEEERIIYKKEKRMKLDPSINKYNGIPFGHKEK